MTNGGPAVVLYIKAGNLSVKWKERQLVQCLLHRFPGDEGEQLEAAIKVMAPIGDKLVSGELDQDDNKAIKEARDEKLPPSNKPTKRPAARTAIVGKPAARASGTGDDNSFVGESDEEIDGSSVEQAPAPVTPPRRPRARPAFAAMSLTCDIECIAAPPVLSEATRQQLEAAMRSDSHAP